MKTLLITLGLGALVPIITFFLSDRKTLAWGRTVGKIRSKFMRGKLGRKLEDVIERTIARFVIGDTLGARQDNSVEKNKEMAHWFYEASCELLGQRDITKEF